ncbi:MAG: sigma-54-dependent Fis family transcriptional regulator [Paludibacteraceae bacterium]|nr:sigma-54-dependent Fis family transcriptional regulator [Paludibacteraceae bacterium]
MSKLLIIDDERSIRNTLKEILADEGHEVDVAENGTQGLEMAQNKAYDLIYSDIKMPGMDGLEVLEKIKGKPLPTSPQGEEMESAESPVVMITGHGDVETAVQALKAGAYDFLLKPLDLNRILITTKNALESKTLKQETKRLRTKVQAKGPQMIGKSAAIQRVRDIIEKVAPTEARVLITGPNGTGKEVVAHLIHQQSSRANGPMVEVNCAAIPSELIESELFGHMKGSFTGAVKDRAGKFEQADGGTLFLDEIGDMSLAAQTKVLRALQESEITRVGSDKAIKVNVRVLAATNKDLAAEIAKGNFREDLFHRLNVIPIHVPSLNERIEDIPLLVDYFCERICGEQGIAVKTFDATAIQALQAREWTGNIRQLRNVIERLIILAGAKITKEDVELYA